MAPPTVPPPDVGLTAMIPPEVGPPTMYPDGVPAHTSQASTQFPLWLKLVTLVVSLVKALPLLGFVLAAVVLTGLASDIGSEWRDEVRSVGAVLALAAAVPFLVLVLQFVGAFWSKRSLLLVVSGLLAVIDVLLTLVVLLAITQEDSDGSALLVMGTVAAGQIAVFVGALKNR